MILDTNVSIVPFWWIPYTPATAQEARQLPVLLVLASGRGERFTASGGGTHKLQADLGGDVFGFSAIRLEDATGQEINVAGLYLHQQHVAPLIDHNDVDFAMLLKLARTAGPVDAVKQRVGVRQVTFQRCQQVEFGMVAGGHGGARGEGGAYFVSLPNLAILGQMGVLKLSACLSWGDSFSVRR